MSNTHRADPYFKLLRIVISLLVLFAVCLVGYFLIDSSLQGKYREEQKRIVDANNAMVQEYNTAVLAQRSQIQPDAAPVWPQPKAEGIDVVSLKGFAVKGVDQVSVTRAEALQGGLLLLNRWHSLPADFSLVEGELKSIMDESGRRVPTTRQQVSLFPAAIQALDQMITAAKAEGLEDYLVRTGYRSMDTQAQLWTETSDALTARNARLTGDLLVEEVRKTVAYPGTSDYQSGLSVELDVWNQNDPVLKAAKIHDTVQGQWLVQNSWKYGYVFRYPVLNYPLPGTVDKSFKTAINLKIDAYRFVGVPHAAVMRQLDLCLEEYIEYLIENEHAAVYEDGQLKYEIFRVEAAPGDHVLRLPEGAASYSVSDDNMGGLVVAVTF